MKLVQEGGTTLPDGPELAQWLVTAIQLRARAFTFSYSYMLKVGMFPPGILAGNESDLISLYSYDNLAAFKECEKIELIFNGILSSVAGESSHQSYVKLAKKLVL